MIKTIIRRKHTHENSYSPRQYSCETWKYPLEGYFSPFTSKEKFGLGRRKGNGNTLGIQREFVRKRAIEDNGAPRALQQWAEGLLPLASSIMGSSEHVTVTCVTCCRSTLEWKGVVRGMNFPELYLGTNKRFTLLFLLERLNCVAWANTLSASGFDILKWYILLTLINYTIK